MITFDKKNFFLLKELRQRLPANIYSDRFEICILN